MNEAFVTQLKAKVRRGMDDACLAEITRRPLPSTKKLEQEIANLDRQLKRLTDRLDKADVTDPDAVITKADEMGRQSAAKRERLKELQRARQRPGVTSVREPDVVAALGRLRELLEGNVSVAAQVLKARGRRRDRVPAGRRAEEPGQVRHVQDRRHLGPCRTRPRQG